MQNPESPATQSPWKVSQQQPLAPRVMDVEWLESQPLLPFLVAAANPVSLWHALSERGLQDSMEVVEWIRGRQLVRVFDLDLWNAETTASSADVSAERFLDWVDVWKEISPDFAACRFAELEEETITLVMSKLVHVLPLFPDEPEMLLQQRVIENGIDSERYWTSPDERFIIAVLPGLEDSFDRIKGFIDGLYAENLRYAGHVLGYSAALVRNETLEDATRWRAGRLADAGFVPSDEARERLARIQNAHAELDILSKLAAEDLPVSGSAFALATSFADEDIQDSIVSLLQSMSPEEVAHQAEIVLGASRISELLSGVPELFSPQYVAEDEDVLRNLIEQSVSRSQKLLSHVDAQNLKALPTGGLAIERGVAYLANEEPNLIGDLKSHFFRLGNALAALRPRMLALATAKESAEVVRGLLNIGLETVLALPQAQPPEGTSFAYNEPIVAGSDAHLAYLIRKVGADLLFRRGWEQLAGVRMHVATRLTADFATLDGAAVSVTLSDGSQARYALTRLIEAARFADVQRWLNARRDKLEPVLFDVLRGLLSEVPVFPTALDQGAGNSVISGHRSFQSQADLEKVTNLFQSLKFAREEATHAETQI